MNCLMNISKPNRLAPRLFLFLCQIKINLLILKFVLIQKCLKIRNPQIEIVGITLIKVSVLHEEHQLSSFIGVFAKPITKHIIIMSRFSYFYTHFTPRNNNIDVMSFPTTLWELDGFPWMYFMIYINFHRINICRVSLLVCYLLFWITHSQ